jgi:hypothetical protein
MDSLVHQLLFDLHQRSRFLSDQLIRLAGKLPTDAESYRDNMAIRVERTADLIQSMLADPGLQHPQLAKHFFHAYKRLAELLHEIESGPLLALKHFDDGDWLMTRLVSAICTEVGYPDSPPLCSSLSTSYYWALPHMDLIFVPCAEPFHLLALPDLYHELAHFLLQRYEDEFVAPVVQIIDEHFDKVAQSAHQNGWAAASIHTVEDARRLWKRHWYLEFAADMIAAYWVGPAFGWTNLRGCVNLGDELFTGGEMHPADDARTTGIRFVLERFGHDEAAEAIDTRWDELVNLSGQQKPQVYDLVYPKDLLAKVAEEICASCSRLQLASLQGQARSTGDISSALLNEAWSMFMNAPDTFAEYEKQRINSLKDSFGVTD